VEYRNLGSAACAGGKCVAGPLLVCDDGNLCSTDSCDPKAGCQYANNASPCDADGSVCTANDVCSGGVCVAGASIEKYCDDKNPCTVDSCDKTSGCQNTTSVLSCDADGDACNGTDTCVAGKCSAGKPLVCDDGNLCSTDSCDPKAGCQYINKAGPCDADGSVCTANDACVGAVCVAGPSIENYCDDKNPCTIDSCDKITGCQKTIAVLPCDADGSACTKDTCKNGKCYAGSPLNCDDGNVCTNDSCDPKKALCQHINNTAPCDADGNVCTLVDTCAAGTCKAGPTYLCNDANACTQDTCKAGAAGVGSSPNLEIADNNSQGVSDSIMVGDLGGVTGVTVSVDLTNSDLTTLTVTLTDPNGAVYTLLNKNGKGAVLNTTWPSPTPLLSGDLSTWNGKNPKGLWTLKVVDTGFTNNGSDGTLKSWSIALATVCQFDPTALQGKACDGGSCHKGICASGCTAASECSDGNACTTDTCSGGVCKNDFNGGAGCCNPYLLARDFEDGKLEPLGASNSSSSSKWQAWNGGQAYTGTWAAYYGNPSKKSFNDGKTYGYLNLPDVQVPASGKTTLEFALYMDTESGLKYDQLKVLATVSGGTAVTLWDKAASGFATDKWQKWSVDLSAHAGKQVKLQFLFDTYDDKGNDGEGVYLDDVKVTKTCP